MIIWGLRRACYFLQDAKELLRKAEYNRETKAAEAKVVTSAARTRRNELTDLERVLARSAFIPVHPAFSAFQ